MNIEVAKEQIFWNAVLKRAGSGAVIRLHKKMIAELDAGGLTNIYYSNGNLAGTTWTIFKNGGVIPSLVEFSPSFALGYKEFFGFYPWSGYRTDLFFTHRKRIGPAVGGALYRRLNEYNYFLVREKVGTDWITVRRCTGSGSSLYCWYEEKQVAVYADVLYNDFMYVNPSVARTLSAPEFFKFVISYSTKFLSLGFQEQSFWDQVQTELTQGLADLLIAYAGGQIAGGGNGMYYAQALSLAINYGSYKKTQEQQNEYNNTLKEIEATRKSNREREEAEENNLDVENSYAKELEYNFDLVYETPKYDTIYESYEISYK